MKKTVLSLATVVAASFLAMAADCSGSNVVPCTTDTDCADDQVCEFQGEDTEGTCVLFDPICEDDVDCDLGNTDSPVDASDCTADADCDDEDLVCVTDGVGQAYCAFADTEDFPCAELDASYTSVNVSGKDICIVDVDQSCDDAGQCVAN